MSFWNTQTFTVQVIGHNSVEILDFFTVLVLKVNFKIDMEKQEVAFALPAFIKWRHFFVMSNFTLPPYSSKVTEIKGRKRSSSGEQGNTRKNKNLRNDFISFLLLPNLTFPYEKRFIEVLFQYLLLRASIFSVFNMREIT